MVGQRVDAGDGQPSTSRRLTLRRDDACAGCGAELAAGDVGWWDKEARTVTCPPCHEQAEAAAGTGPAAPDPPPIDSGVAGASAAREYERRKRRREQSTRERHPHIGGMLLRLRDAPQHETAWARGASGEEQVAESLEMRLAGSDVILLHDRRIPGSRANIDHLAIAPTGVYVIDAKALRGKVKIRTPLFGKQELFVAGRNRTKLLEGLDRQVAAVREVLGPEHEDIPVCAVLCFTEADLPMLGRRARGHLLLYRKGLAKELRKDGPVGAERIGVVARVLMEGMEGA